MKKHTTIITVLLRYLCIWSSVSYSYQPNVLWLLDEKNDNLKAVYKEKMAQFLDRAEYIKKTALAAPEH